MIMNVMNILSALLLLSFLNIESALAQDVTFSKETFAADGVTLPYRKANIMGDGDKASLVIYLHGGSSKGNDNETQMNEPGIGDICSWLVGNKRKAVVLVPQCPKDKSWIGSMLDVVKSLLQSYVDRGVAGNVYIFGGSMGGTGTWNMLALYPGFFTAAMPVAGNPTGLGAENISKTPLYTVMGTADKIMNVQPVETLLSEMADYGASYRLDIEQDWTHEDVCKKSYTPERLAWVFGHGNGATDGIGHTESDCLPPVAVKWYDLQGHALPDAPDGKGIYLKRCMYSDGRSNVQKIVL